MFMLLDHNSNVLRIKWSVIMKPLLPMYYTSADGTLLSCPFNLTLNLDPKIYVYKHYLSLPYLWCMRRKIFNFYLYVNTT